MTRAHYTWYLEIRLTLWFCGWSRVDGNHVWWRIHILALTNNGIMDANIPGP